MNSELAVMNHYLPPVRIKMNMKMNMKKNRRLLLRREGGGGRVRRIDSRSFSNNRLAPISIREVPTIASLLSANAANINTVAAAIAILDAESPPPTQKMNTTKNIIIPLDVMDDDDDNGYNIDDSELISIIKTVVNGHHHQEDQEVLASALVAEAEDADADKNSNNNNNVVSLSSSKKRQRRMVRFALPEGATVSVSEGGEDKISKKLKLTHDDTNDDNDASVSWYTSRELKDINRSIIFAVKRYELSCSGSGSGNQDVQDNLSLLDQSLEKFLSCNRTTNRIIRNRMIETCYAVRQFELCTNTNQSIMLSQLLQRLRNSDSQSISYDNNKTNTSVTSDQIYKEGLGLGYYFPVYAALTKSRRILLKKPNGEN